MSLILSIDLSTKPGLAVFRDGKLENASTCFNDKTVEDFNTYPYSYIEFCRYTVNRLSLYIKSMGYHWPQFDTIVLEETTASRQNYSQKRLEWLHYELLLTLESHKSKIVYIRDGTWKRINEIKMSKEDKANNQKIKRLKQKTGKRVIRRDEKGNAIRKIGKKDVYIRMCNSIFGTNYSRKEEDVAAACLLGRAYLIGAPLCDGKITGGLLINSKKD